MDCANTVLIESKLCIGPGMMLAKVESVACPGSPDCAACRVAAWLQTGSGGGEVSRGLINIIRRESCHDKLNSIYPGTQDIQNQFIQLHIYHMD